MKYRYLTFGEVIKPKDEYNNGNGVWNYTSCSGYTITSEDVDDKCYRRLVKNNTNKNESNKQKMIGFAVFDRNNKPILYTIRQNKTQALKAYQISGQFYNEYRNCQQIEFKIKKVFVDF